MQWFRTSALVLSSCFHLRSFVNNSVSLFNWVARTACVAGANESTLHLYSGKTSEPKYFVSYVNGIYHTEEDWRRISSHLSETFQCEVRPFYLPTTGYFIADLSQVSIAIVRRSRELELARNLASHLRLLLKEAGPEGRILHIAHSGGAILTYLAARHHMTTNETKHVDVITFGGGHSITRKYFGGRIVNYYAFNDPLTLVDRRALALARRFGGGFPVLVLEPKHNTSFIFIEGITKNPVMDHSMEGPTYRKAVEWEADHFRRRRTEFLSKFRRKFSWLRRLRKISARLTNSHHFWANVSMALERLQTS